MATDENINVKIARIETKLDGVETGVMEIKETLVGVLKLERELAEQSIQIQHSFSDRKSLWAEVEGLEQEMDQRKKFENRLTGGLMLIGAIQAIVVGVVWWIITTSNEASKQNAVQEQQIKTVIDDMHNHINGGQK